MTIQHDYGSSKKNCVGDAIISFLLFVMNNTAYKKNLILSKCGTIVSKKKLSIKTKKAFTKHDNTKKQAKRI